LVDDIQGFAAPPLPQSRDRDRTGFTASFVRFASSRLRGKVFTENSKRSGSFSASFCAFCVSLL
jgi:hypothetical protein